MYLKWFTVGDDLLRDIRSSTLQSIDSAKEAGRLLFECLDKCNNIMETVQNNRMRIDLNNVYKITTISIRHDDPGKCM